MIYHFMDYLNNHWKDIATMIEENYANEYDDSYVCVLGDYQNKDFSYYKESYPGKKIIIYQLEPLVHEHWTSPEQIIPNLRQADEVWDYDFRNIEKLKSLGIIAQYKPLVYTEKLKRIKNLETPDIDVLFYGIFTEHRFNSLYSLSISAVVNRFKYVCLSQFDGDDLDEFISRSKIIISLNTYGNYDLQKQTRIYYALINNKKVLSEKCSFNYYDDLIEEFDINTCSEVITNILKTKSWKDTNISDQFKKMTSQLQSYEKQVEKYKNNSSIVDMKRIIELENLNDLYNAGTDKHTCHSYLELYANQFSKYRLQPNCKLLEIGCFTGGSLLLWDKYFSDVKFVAVDTNIIITGQTINRFNKNNFLHLYEENPYTEACRDKILNNDGKFDIIIDDKYDHNHYNHILLIDLYMKLLKDDGIMIIEDIQQIEFADQLKKYAESFGYESIVYDLRSVKNRWDDIVLIIRKI